LRGAHWAHAVGSLPDLLRRTEWLACTWCCRYQQAWSILEGYRQATGKQLLSAAEEAAVLGGSLQQLFPGAWQA
jgi:hypothetical protein